MLFYVLVLALSTTPIWGAAPECEPDDDFVAPHEDCTKFYTCFNGDLSVMSCPDGLHFNPQELFCDFPDQAGCEGSTGATDEPTEGPTDEPTDEPTEEPTTSEATTTEKPSADCKPGDDFLLPFPGDCTKFYICDNGNLLESDCPDGLHFNPVELMCDFPDEAGCE